MRDEAAWAVMVAQHGVIDRAGARRAGLTDRQIKRRVDRGEWVRLAPGVYRHAGITRSWRGELMAACMMLRGIASHRSAAVLHEMEGFRPGGRDVSVAHGRYARIGGIRLHQSTQMDRAAPAILDGIPCTGLARTVLDVSHDVSYRRLEDTVDALIRDGRLEWKDLVSVLTRHARRGRNGAASLRRFLDARTGDESIPLSVWNRIAIDLLVAAGLPEPRLEYRVLRVDGSLVAQVDLGYPASKIAIELDSVRFHLNREAFERDRRRWNALVAEGWTVLAFTWADFIDRPHEVIARVRAALANA